VPAYWSKCLGPEGILKISTGVRDAAVLTPVMMKYHVRLALPSRQECCAFMHCILELTCRLFDKIFKELLTVVD